jgi:hypothetical protein
MLGTMLGLLSFAACSLFVGDDLSKANPTTAQLNDGGLDGASPDAARDGQGLTDGEAADAALGPVFIGSRLVMDAASNPLVQGPAGVKPGDLLVIIWRVGGFSQPMPAGWSLLGAAYAATVNGQTNYAFGYHVLEANEDENTTYDFTTGYPGTAIGFAAFRGARKNQPLTPTVIGQLPVSATLEFDAAPFETRGTTLSLYMFGTQTGVGFSDVAGLKKLEVNADLGIYCGSSPLAGSTQVPGPHIQLTSPSGGPSEIAGASLGIVVP